MDEEAESGKVTVVLADDHVIVRDGIRMVLESEPGIQVVAEAGTAEDAVRYVLGHKPSILVLDLNMPGESSLEAIPRILESSPGTKVIVLTMQSEPAFVRSALQAGASGYVVKHAAAKELVDAISTSLAGDTYLNPTLGAKLAAAPNSGGPPDELTPREVEVLTLLAQGYMNPEVAGQLVLSVRTVETHRANIQRKTGVSSRAELISYAKQNGFAT
jgi:two-component system, NarL family, response regulator NreC